ncbi:MAG: ATP-binding cassette domain-containing protein [Alphaproteobacteria bacterium]|jgi:ABC-type glutathione transport system ATPase component|nr:ATP-binding cassette domain-containing protein [Alphaproteobacteria bacterium]
MIEIIMGASGVGKTTYLKSLLAGENIADVAYLPQEIGQVFNPLQTIHRQIFEMKFEMADFQYYFAGLNLQYLENSLHRYPYEFSAGELQRLALLIIFLRRAKHIYLDEPSAFLDKKNQESLSAVLKLQKCDITVITHNQNFALSLGGRIRYMGDCIQPYWQSTPYIPYNVPFFDTLAKSKLTLIIGESGIGKTTYLRNFHKFLLKNGEKAAFLAQNAAISPLCTVLKILLEALRVRNKNRFNRRTDTKEIIKIFLDLKLSTKLLKKYPHELSTGEKQKVLIIRILLLKPQWLLLDEPTSNLDNASSTNIVELLLHVHKEYNINLAVISHNADLFQADCIVNFNKQY